MDVSNLEISGPTTIFGHISVNHKAGMPLRFEMFLNAISL